MCAECDEKENKTKTEMSPEEAREQAEFEQLETTRNDRRQYHMTQYNIHDTNETIRHYTKQDGQYERARDYTRRHETRY